MAFPRRLYPKEFKLNAVRLVEVEHRRACDVADELDIPRKTMYAWLHESRSGQIADGAETSREVTPEQAEIARLKA